MPIADPVKGRKTILASSWCEAQLERLPGSEDRGRSIITPEARESE